MRYFRHLLILSSLLLNLVAIRVAVGQPVESITITPAGSALLVDWSTADQDWSARVEQDTYLGEGVALISVSVKTGNETFIGTIPNVYYRGVLLDDSGAAVAQTTVYVDRSHVDLPFTGFVTSGDALYIIEADAGSPTGLRMRLEPTANDVAPGDDDSGNNGWGKGGKGGALNPDSLYPRGATPDRFPSLDMYLDPSFLGAVGESNAIARVMQNLAVANTIFAQSDMKQINLLAIVLPDEDLGRNTSKGNILHGVERLRTYTVQPDSADVSMVYSGDEFTQSSYWGWAEGGYACELQQAVDLGTSINTHQVGKAAFAVVDLPSLMQRGWILAHEMSHTIGGIHIADDPLSDGFFQPELALKDYVADCDAKQWMYQSCAYDPQTKAFTDYYQCD